jgi:hypothetical protein
MDDRRIRSLAIVGVPVVMTRWSTGSAFPLAASARAARRANAPNASSLPTVRQV